MGELTAPILPVCRECGRDHGHVMEYACQECLGTLEVRIDFSRVQVSRSKNLFEEQEPLEVQEIDPVGFYAELLRVARNS